MNNFTLMHLIKGLIFSRKDVDSFLEQLKLEPKEIFYEPCNHLSIIQRVLRNLVVSFEKLGENEKVVRSERVVRFYFLVTLNHTANGMFSKWSYFFSRQKFV